MRWPRVGIGRCGWRRRPDAGRVNFAHGTYSTVGRRTIFRDGEEASLLFGDIQPLHQKYGPQATASLVEFETEQAEIRDIVSKLAAPTEFDRFKLDFGEDSTGTPAVWVRFIVEDNPQPSEEQVQAATALSHTVTRELLDQGYRWWPYVRFVAAS